MSFLAAEAADSSRLNPILPLEQSSSRPLLRAAIKFRQPLASFLMKPKGVAAKDAKLSEGGSGSGSSENQKVNVTAWLL